MLNKIWAGMLLIGIAAGMALGNIEAVSAAFFDAVKDAVNLCMTMLGIVALWTGMMKILEVAGGLEKIAVMLNPLIKKLFPDIPKGHQALFYISANITANILGLGWAATPAGLKAMKALSELSNHSKYASNAMCTFLILNISSLQLIPVNIIAYRSQYQSVAPTKIILPAIIATSVSTMAAIIYLTWKNNMSIRGKNR